MIRWMLILVSPFLFLAALYAIAASEPEDLGGDEYR